MSKNSEAASVLLFFCLFIVYSATTVFCLSRIIKLHHFAPQWRKAQIFYVLVLVQVALRSICMLILAIQQSEISTDIMFLLISIPDTLFLISYILLIWQLSALFYFAHIQDPNQENFLSKFTKKSKTSLISLIIILIICILSLSQGILYLIALTDTFTNSQVSFETDILNILIPSICALIMLILSLKYSGIPLKSEIWKQRFSHIFRVTVFWTATRLFRGISSLIGSYFYLNLQVDLEKEREDTKDYIMLIIILVLSEILCVYTVQDYGFLGIFVFSEEDSENVQVSTVNSQVEDRETIVNTSISISQYNESPIVNSSEIQEIEDFKNKKQGLGKLIKGNFKSSNIMYRKITLPRLSGYVIEELTSEIESHRKINFPFVLPLIAVVIELPVVGFITPIMPNSLYKLIHVDKQPVSMSIKFQILEKVASQLHSIHSENKSHGHLTSHNVLLDDQLTPFIGDFGFAKIKKYAGIVNGYSNISAWSSPGLISDKRLTPIRTSPADDSYSFGMIVWEILSEQEPFPGYNRKQLNTHIVELGHRPVLNDGIPEDVAEIIIKCWNPDPNIRPDLGTISNVLESYNRL